MSPFLFLSSHSNKYSKIMNKNTSIWIYLILKILLNLPHIVRGEIPYSKNGMVVSAHKLASEAGVTILTIIWGH